MTHSNLLNSRKPNQKLA